MMVEGRALQVSVVLEGVNPPIWRRLVVDATLRLSDLHRVLQIAMGWKDSHLHCFEVGDVVYGPLDPTEPDEGVVDEAGVSIGDVFGSSPLAGYLYDFGDEWRHDLLVEPAAPTTSEPGRAQCLDGARACPPEDSGGPRGYEDLLMMLSSPMHEDYADVRVRLGPSFDPERFDRERVNARLAQLDLGGGSGARH